MKAGENKGTQAVIGAYAIYGLNVVFCKDLVSSHFVSPTLLVAARLAVAALLFWLLSLFTGKEAVEKKDFPKLFVASLLAMFLPFMTMLWGLTMSSPFDASLISTIKPLVTFALACVILHQKITTGYVLGLLLALAGAVMLVCPGATDAHSSTSLPGLLILLLNALSFSLYLILFKPLISKYKVVTTQKWMLLFAFIVSIPFALKGIRETQLVMITPRMWLEFGFLAVFATFITYFLTPIGQKTLSATRYSIYSYTQLLVSAIVGVAMGLDRFSIWKILAAALVICGVWVYKFSETTSSSSDPARR